MEEMENMKNLVESLLEKYLMFAADSKIKEEFKPKGKPKQNGNPNQRKPGNNYRR